MTFQRPPKWNFEMWFHMISWCWVHAPVIVLFQATKNPEIFPNLLPPASHRTLSTWKVPPISSCSPGVIAFFGSLCPRSPSIQHIATFWLLPQIIDRSGGKARAGWFLFGEGWDHVSHSLPLASNDRIHICCGTVSLKASHVFVGHPKSIQNTWSQLSCRWVKKFSLGHFCNMFLPASGSPGWKIDLCFGTTRLFSGLNLLQRASKS